MNQILMVVMAIAVFSIPAEAYEYKWKTLPPFEISFIDGYKESYGAGEPMIFYVEGKSPSKVEAEPQTGFNVQAYIVDTTAKKNYAGATGEYDENKRAWLIKLTAPKDNTKTYEVSVRLYCGKDESPCAEIYGRAAQTSKTLNLQVQ